MEMLNRAIDGDEPRHEKRSMRHTPPNVGIEPPYSVGSNDGLGPLVDSEEDPARLWAEIHTLRASVAGPKGYASWQEAATSERMRRVRKERQIETLLRGITDARCLMDPIWRERMGAESVREYVQRGLRCIDSAVTDCQFTGPNVELTGRSVPK